MDLSSTESDLIIDDSRGAPIIITENPLHQSRFLISPPDWRWQQAGELFRTGKCNPLRTGSFPIVRAIRFLQASLANDATNQLKQLAEEDPSLEAGIRIASSPGRQRFELQCRVLARQDSDEIALQMGLTKPVVETYLDLFFDVRSHLEASDYIVYQVAGMSLQGPPSIPTLILTSAYFHGPIVMEACLDYLDHLGETHDLTTEEGRRREGVELWFQAQIIADSPEMNASWAKHADLIFSNRPTISRQRRASDVISAQIDQMLEECLRKNKSAPETVGVRLGQYVEEGVFELACST